MNTTCKDAVLIRERLIASRRSQKNGAGHLFRGKWYRTPISRYVHDSGSEPGEILAGGVYGCTARCGGDGQELPARTAESTTEALQGVRYLLLGDG